MIQVTINPFPSLASDFNSILDYIIATIPSPKVDEVNAALVAKVKLIFSYGDSPLNDVELNSYLPTAINAYINNDIKGTSINQAPFVILLLDKIKEVPPLQILDFIADVEDQIAQSGLSLPEQNQLYFATSVAAASFNYWNTQINMPVSPWASYLNSNIAVNIANLPYWIIASVQTALYFCFKGNYTTGSKEPPKISGPEYVNVLTASAGMAAGKVIFNWVPKISLNFIERGRLLYGQMTDSNSSRASHCQIHWLCPAGHPQDGNTYNYCYNYRHCSFLGARSVCGDYYSKIDEVPSNSDNMPTQ